MNIRQLLKQEAKGISVLYVEDELETQEQISKIFNLFFKKVSCAENGQAALAKYEKDTYDLVITDLTMPKMDGMELIHKVKELSPNQRIIVITAHNNPEHLLDTIELQVDGFILKPISMDKLLELLYKVSHELYLERKDDVLSLGTHNDYFEELSELKALLMRATPSVIALMSVKNLGSLRETFGIELIDHILAESREYFLEHQPKGASFYQWSKDLFLFYFGDEDKLHVYELIKSFLQKQAAQNISFNGTLFPVSYTCVIVSGEGLDIISKINTIQDSIHVYKNQRISIYESNADHLLAQKDAFYWVRKTLAAIEKNQIVPFYQPIYQLTDDTIYGYEVLARIEEDGEFLEPRLFIEPTEKAGVVDHVSKIIYEKAFTCFSSQKLKIHFNVSEEELRSDFLMSKLSALGDQYKIDTDCVVLEIDYQAPYIQDENIIKNIQALKKLGYKILIENFAESQMNMYTLQKCMPDIIKFDSKFLLYAFDDMNVKAILKAFLLFTKSLQVKSSAVGIENEDLFKFVKSLDFDYAQGYYLGKPAAKVDK